MVRLAEGLSLPAAELATPPLVASARALPAGTAERLWAEVNKTPGCHLWTGYTKNGYGALSINGRQRYTHRLAYALHVGPIPAGQKVCHSCDVHPCVRVDHLFLGTQAVNLADMRDKGRDSPPPHFFGEEHPLVKLTDAQVAEVYRLCQMRAFPQREIAKMYGVSYASVRQIARGAGRASRVAA